MFKKTSMAIAIIVAVTMSITAKTEKIGLVINSDLFTLIEDAINTYTDDLKTIQGIEVVWVETEFDDTRNKYQELWDALKAQYDEQGIDGVIFIGDLPVVDCGSGDFNPDPQCDLFWMDMDANAFSGSGPEFSRYNGSGPEIWMTRVTSGYFESQVNKSEDEIVNEYFANVAERMHGGLVDEDTSMFIMGDDGVSYWAGIDDEHLDEMYYTNTTVHLESQHENTGTIWENGLKDGHEYFMVYNHSNYNMHQTSPRCDISTLYESDNNIRFGQMFACLNSRLDYANMVAAYGLLNKGLVCYGAGKSGSIKPNHYHYYNDPLHVEGNLFGDALKQWWQDDGINEMDWGSANVMEGVGTLKLKPYDDATKIKTGAQGFRTTPVKFRQSIAGAALYIPYRTAATVIITDMQGRELMSFKTDKATWHTLPKKLTPGIHIAQIKCQNSKTIHKFDVVR